MRTDGFEVLLVDDSGADAELTLHALRNHALLNTVHVARDGEEALNFLFCRDRWEDRVDWPLPQLILLDLKLPKVGGPTVNLAPPRQPLSPLARKTG